MDREQEREIEQEIEKLIAKYYWHVDHREFDKAVELFTEDAEWIAMAVHLNGRDEILEALKPALGTGTIRHVVTNFVVNVIDADRATCNFYHTIYYTPDAEFETADGPIPFEGPHRTHDHHDEWRRTPEGWRTARRTSHTIFRRNPGELVKLETWAQSAGKYEAGQEYI